MVLITKCITKYFKISLFGTSTEVLTKIITYSRSDLGLTIKHLSTRKLTASQTNKMSAGYSETTKPPSIHMATT